MATARLNAFAALVEVGLSNVFDESIKTHPLLYKGWLATKPMKEWIEDENLVSGFGAMPEKGIGTAFQTDIPEIAPIKKYTGIAYGLAFVIEHELMRWDKYGIFKPITRKLAWSGQDRKNITAYAILNNSFSTADAKYTTYAGEALCSTAHVLLRGGTAKNRATAPTALSYLGMQEALTDFQLMTNEDGLFIMISPDTLICPPALEWVGETLLGSATRPDNANRSKNTLSGKVKGPHCAPYLTSATAWWLVCSKAFLKEHSMSFHMGEDLMLRRDYERSTWNLTFQMYGSWRIGVYHWYGLWGTTGV
jgi:hypothetical protein